MSNLISRETVISTIHNYFKSLIDKTIFDIDVVDCAKGVSEAIDSIPNGYDLDKVVDHLTKRFDFCQEMAEKNDKARLEEMAFSWRQVANGVMDAIDIVKGAVKDE